MSAAEESSNRIATGIGWRVDEGVGVILSGPRQSAGRIFTGLSEGQQSLASALGILCLVLAMEAALLRIGFFDDGQSIWWPTNGLALALMLRAERRKWPVILAPILLASLIGELRAGYAWPINSVNMAANSIGPLIGAMMLPRFRRLEHWLQEPRLVYRVILFSLVLGPLASATIFASYRYLNTGGFSFWSVLERRALADMLGYALFTPLVLVLCSRPTYQLLRARTLPGTIALLVLVAGVTWGVFAQSSYALSFVLASVMLIVTLHLGFSAAVIAVNVLAAIATSETMHGHGPFILGGGAVMSSRILLLQTFLTFSMIAVFSVSVIQVEREVFQAKLRRAYKEMEELATTDSLTGVTNRRRFEEALEVEWARAFRMGDPISLLILDADHFKSYNDFYGHPAGDHVLRMVAGVAKEFERRSTDLLARYGGEEFAFLLPTNTQDGAARIAEDLRASIEALYGQAESGLKRAVTVSVGCATMVPGPGLTSAMLIDAADKALYRAKQRGRNRVEVAGSHGASDESGTDGDFITGGA